MADIVNRKFSNQQSAISRQRSAVSNQQSRYHGCSRSTFQRTALARHLRLLPADCYFGSIPRPTRSTMLKHHSEETKAATGILLVSGTALTYLSHRWGLGGRPMHILGAAAGPIALILGLGTAIHGRAMPPTHITLPARIWGLLGSIAGSINLWWLGFFQRQGSANRAAWLLPVALIVAWLLPERFYRGHSHASDSELPGK
jgi:hypothetical protein